MPVSITIIVSAGITSGCLTIILNWQVNPLSFQTHEIRILASTLCLTTQLRMWPRLQKLPVGIPRIFTIPWGHPVGIFTDSHGFRHGYHGISIGYFVRHRNPMLRSPMFTENMGSSRVFPLVTMKFPWGSKKTGEFRYVGDSCYDIHSSTVCPSSPFKRHCWVCEYASRQISRFGEESAVLIHKQKHIATEKWECRLHAPDR